MGQLTLKELDKKLRTIDIRLSNLALAGEASREKLDDLEGRISTLGETVSVHASVTREGFVEVDRLIGGLIEAVHELDGRENGTAVPLNVVRAIIEALHGVRLQRAGEYAQALELEYFPVVDVESTEGD